jgi:hypothetical protein
VIPMDTCASIAEPVANSIAASSAVFTMLLMLLSLPDPIVGTKGRNASGTTICHCERYSWPEVQADPTLPQSGKNLGSKCLLPLSRSSRTTVENASEITDLTRQPKLGHSCRPLASTDCRRENHTWR